MRVGVAVVTIALVGCATRSAPPRPGPDAAPTRNVVAVQNGLASYYADSFQGRTTASGATFDNNALVAAHPSLPFGSRVRVTNLENDRSVEVRIIDRGPAASVRARGVIIDLSRTAAERLDFVRAGRVRVRVEVLQRNEAR